MPTALIRTQNFDVTIFAFIENGNYFLRYEFISTVDANIQTAIEKRLRKSFILSATTPEARSESGIVRKAELMRGIFRVDFGLAADIRYEF